MVEKFLQTLIDALAVGSLYALIALGYTMVYGILKFINFAHSDVFVLGAWVSFTAAVSAGWAGAAAVQPVAPWVWVVLVGMVAVGGLLIAYERLLQDRLPERLRATLPRSTGGLTVLLAGVWGWGVIALLLVAKALRQSESLALLSGGAILLTAMATCGLVGFCLERMAYKPLRSAPRLNVLITAIGVSLLLQNLGQLNWMFGTRPQPMPALLPDVVLNTSTVASGTVSPGSQPGTVRFDEAVTFEPGRVYQFRVRAGDQVRRLAVLESGTKEAGADILVRGDLGAAEGAQASLLRMPRTALRLVDVIGAGTAVALMLALDWLVFRTRLGRAMRAVSFNTNNAALMGIPVDRIISFTFVLGAMLAAAAGFLYAQKYPGLGQPASATWVLLGLKAFVAAVVGGIGNIRGAMLGGLLIGLLEFFGAAYVSPELRDLYVFSLLIVVLLFRPSGLLGKTTAEKV